MTLWPPRLAGQGRAGAGERRASTAESTQWRALGGGAFRAGDGRRLATGRKVIFLRSLSFVRDDPNKIERPAGK